MELSDGSPRWSICPGLDCVYAPLHSPWRIYFSNWITPGISHFNYCGDVKTLLSGCQVAAVEARTHFVILFNFTASVGEPARMSPVEIGCALKVLGNP